MQQLSRIYSSIVGDEIAFLFSVIIVCWLALAVIILFIPAFAKRQFGTRLLSITSSSLATLGVLGTFTGILIGLLDFNVERVDDSVPKLLEGLKIAFTTSIVGISASIAFRLTRTIAPSSPQATETSPEDIHRVLREIRDDGRMNAAETREQMLGLRTAISSDGEASLLTQVQKLRTTVQDGQSELVKEFHTFAEHMVENNQKAVVEALEVVIRDFNQNLTEQFGENFKELNFAVSALVEWQHRYREHVDALQTRLDAAVKAIQATETALSSVEKHTSSIPAAVEKLEPTLVEIKAQTDALEGNLSAISQIREQAIEAFPIIEANLEKVTNDLASSVEGAVTMSQTVVAENERAIQEAWASSSEKINQQFADFDDQMQQELQRSLELLGSNLASLSEKFVSDYGPLTEKLQTLVETSRSIR